MAPHHVALTNTCGLALPVPRVLPDLYGGALERDRHAMRTTAAAPVVFTGSVV